MASSSRNANRRSFLSGSAKVTAVAVIAPVTLISTQAIALPSIAETEWEAELSRIGALWLAFEQETDGELSSVRNSEHLAAVDALLASPAPSLRAVEQKLALIAQTYDDCVIENELIAWLHQDLLRLLGDA